jgi:hypothetical protein
MEIFAPVFGGFLPVPACLKTAFAEKTARGKRWYILCRICGFCRGRFGGVAPCLANVTQCGAAFKPGHNKEK